VKGWCPRPLDEGDPDFQLQNTLGGGKRDRTADLLHAMQALSQLSYTPTAASFTTDLLGWVFLAKNEIMHESLRLGKP